MERATLHMLPLRRASFRRGLVQFVSVAVAPGNEAIQAARGWSYAQPLSLLVHQLAAMVFRAGESLNGERSTSGTTGRISSVSYSVLGDKELKKP